MPLADKIVFDRITIVENGQIQLRQVRRIYEMPDFQDLVAEQHRTFWLFPGQDVTKYPLRVRAVCAAVWTPSVIAAYRAAQASQHTP